MAAITIKDMSVSYNKGKTFVLDKLNLNIKDGEFCVFLGPSGCGKSTAMYSIAGLLEPYEGNIYFGDTLMTEMEKGKKKTFIPPQERNIAMVFQEYALYPNMTVRENMAFALKTKKVPKEEIDRLVMEQATKLELTELLDRRIAQLSGGQRQRVALGRALVRSPQVFLLDEPLGNLDAKLRDQVRYELKKIQKELNVTTIYVTHDQTEAMTMGTDIVIIYKGKIQQHGTPHEVYDDPANLFVAQFIGDPGMNALKLSDGGFVGFKPRAVIFGKGENGLNLTGTVLTSEFMGYDELMTIDLGCGHISIRNKERKEAGDQVELFIPQDELFYFDADQNRTDTPQTGEVVSVFHVDD